MIACFTDLDTAQLCLQWRNQMGGTVFAHLPRWLLLRVLAYRLQAAALGDLDKATARSIRASRGDAIGSPGSPFTARKPRTRDGVGLNPGALLVREWKGKLERVMVLDNGFAWNGRTFGSLSKVAKAIASTSWNGHRFFGLRSAKDPGLGKEKIIGKPMRTAGVGLPGPRNSVEPNLMTTNEKKRKASDLTNLSRRPSPRTTPAFTSRRGAAATRKRKSMSPSRTNPAGTEMDVRR
jgi:hypothetical protein